MRTKLIFLDVDGTLLPSGSPVPPPRAMAAIRSAQRQGHQVFLCTGRSLSTLQHLLPYGFDGVIASAGGYVLCHQQVLFDHPIPQEVLAWALDVLHGAGAACVLESQTGAFGDDEVLDLLARGFALTGDLARWKETMAEDLSLSPMTAYDGRPVYKVMFVSEDPAGVARASEVLDETFFLCPLGMATADGIYHGELIHRSFSKGAGIRRICAHQSVPLEDTVGIGDSMNDLSMLETVGIGVCMGNGAEALKARCDLIAPPAEKDGLAAVFQQLGLGEEELL